MQNSVTSPAFTAPRPRAVLVGLALGLIYLSTGTTFLAVKLVSQHVAPVQLSVVRLLGATLLLAPVTLWRLQQGAALPAGRALRGAAITGFLLLAVGQTALIWGVSRMPAGIAAVIGSAAPLFIAIISVTFLREPLPRRQVAGIILGLAGIVALTSTAPAGEIVPAGLAALLLSAAAWAVGSLYSRRATLPRDPVVSINLQLLLGGLMVAPLAAVEARRESVSLSGVSWPVWGGLAYLVVAAVTSFAAFTWLNRNTSSTLANTFAYVSPVLALALSAIFLGEAMTLLKGAAVLVTLAGVALMIRDDRTSA